MTTGWGRGRFLAMVGIGAMGLACGGLPASSPLSPTAVPEAEADAMRARPIQGSGWAFEADASGIELSARPSQSVPEVEPNDDPEVTAVPHTTAVTGTVQGSDPDHIRFTIPKAGTWSFILEGEGVKGKLRGNGVDLGILRPDGDTRAAVHGTYLQPGEVTVRVHGKGSYAVWGYETPSPTRGEREPNDDYGGSHALRFDTPRSGVLAPEGDVDLYRFTLKGPSHVRLHWRIPGEAGVHIKDLTANLSMARSTKPVTGEDHWDGWLEAGDYSVALTAKKASLEPYQVGFELLDPLHRPADLEPNDTLQLARDLPSSLSVKGTLGPLDPRDVFRIPPPSSTARLRVEGATDSLGLTVRDGANKVVRPEDDGSWSLEAGSANWLEVRGAAAYDLGITLEGVVPATRAAQPAVSLTVSGPTDVAAFREVGQQLELTAVLEGRGTVWLRTHTSDPAWSAAEQQVEVDGRKEVKLAVQVPPDVDEDPVYITVGIRSDFGGIPRTATHRVRGVCGAPLTNARTHWPLPDGIVGAWNRARTDRGAVVTSDAKRHGPLFDGITPRDQSVRVKEPVSIALAPGGAVRGFLLDSVGRSGNPRDVGFRIEMSADGQAYEPVLEARLPRALGETFFPLPKPREGSHVRLSFAEPAVALSEFKVLGATQNASERNIASRAHGAQFVRTRPFLRLDSMLAEVPGRAQTYRIQPGQPLELVVGFEHGREARVTALELDQPASVPSVVSKVALAISSESPVGPWSPLGEWELPEVGASNRFDLPAPRWARYLKLTALEEAGRSHALPATLRVFEAAGEPSVAGEYGKYNPRGPRQLAEGAAIQANGGSGDPGGVRNETKDSATPLALGEAVQGAVSVGEDVDVFRVVVPAGHNHLALEVRGDPAVHVTVSVADESGQSVPVLVHRESGLVRFEAAVSPGAYFVDVSEPPRSIGLLWDQSGSVSSFVPQIYGAVTEFVEGVKPGREVANLYPFQGRDGAFLSETWSHEPAELQRALNAYDRRDGSSDAESAMLDAVREMEPREGTKALLVLTDANTTSSARTPELWERLAIVRPRIFTMELHIGDAQTHQDRMQGWADVDAGHYTAFGSAADLDVAFSRASCHLRRPAGYALTAQSSTQAPPEPGAIEVLAGDASLDGFAIELILDASGSMLKKIGGKSRIEMAKTVLKDLVTDTVPKGTPLALRVFGHVEPKSCRTDLEVPLGPLEPSEMTKTLGAIRARNLAKTPIGDSLLAVQKDLAAHKGPKLVVLLTDGEETCDGDPAAAIETLEASGMDVRMNIVGFAIEDGALKSDFQAWARRAGGLYVDAGTEKELGGAMLAALSPKVQVVDAAGQVTAEGMVGAGVLSVPPGRYTVRILSSPVSTHPVEVKPGETLQLLAP